MVCTSFGTTAPTIVAAITGVVTPAISSHLILSFAAWTPRHTQRGLHGESGANDHPLNMEPHAVVPESETKCFSRRLLKY